MDPLDEGLAEWELPDPYYEPWEHASSCRCDVCVYMGAAVFGSVVFRAAYDLETGMLIRTERSTE